MHQCTCNKEAATIRPTPQHKTLKRSPGTRNAGRNTPSGLVPRRKDEILATMRASSARILFHLLQLPCESVAEPVCQSLCAFVPAQLRHSESVCFVAQRFSQHLLNTFQRMDQQQHVPFRYRLPVRRCGEQVDGGTQVGLQALRWGCRYLHSSRLCLLAEPICHTSITEVQRRGIVEHCHGQMLR